MSTQNELLLEHRVSETELETIRLRRQVEELTAQVRRLAQAPTATPAPRYTPPAERTTIHEKKSFDFFAKLPPVRKLVDFHTTNTASGETLRLENYSVAQIERACQQFSRLQFVSRKKWKGNRWLYGVARKLFAQAGAIVQHPGSRVWSWCTWPHERRAVCARIVAALSRQN